MQPKVAKTNKREDKTMCMYKLALQQTVRRNARAAIAAMRRTSELNGNSEMTLENINNEIRQARQARKATV